MLNPTSFLLHIFVLPFWQHNRSRSSATVILNANRSPTIEQNSECAIVMPVPFFVMFFSPLVTEGIFMGRGRRQSAVSQKRSGRNSELLLRAQVYLFIELRCLGVCVLNCSVNPPWPG